MAAIKHTRGVLDLTFMEIDGEEKLADQIKSESALQIRPSSPKRTRASHTASGNVHVEKPGGVASKTMKPEVVKAIRLSNNGLTNMETLVGPMLANIDTREIQWLDLSFNQIASLGSGESISAAFPNVTTIYLHANKLSRLSQLKKLKAFPNLKSLSLYGNPIEEHKHYRNYVMYHCPKLGQFDSSPVTGSERVSNAVWAKNFRKTLHKEDDDY